MQGYGRLTLLVVWAELALDRQAEALAKAGQGEQAEATARSITNLDTQADALAKVAEALAAAGESRSANRVTAAICEVGHWTIAAKAVLLLDPTAFTLLAHTLQMPRT